MNWQNDWEKLLVASFIENNIEYERTTFRISNQIREARDNEWGLTIVDCQIIKLEHPTGRGKKMRVIGLNSNGIKVELGTVDFVEEKYRAGIVGHLVEKDLSYKDGDIKSCLEFYQPVYLIDTKDIPDSMMSSSVFRLQGKAKLSTAYLKGAGSSVGDESCVFWIVAFVVIVFFFVFLVIL